MTQPQQPQQQQPSERTRQNEDDDDVLTVMTVDSDAPEDANPPPAIHHQHKLGGKFLGCCCDYRKAVLILGAATVSMGLLDLLFRIGSILQQQRPQDQQAYQEPPYDDDQLVDQLIALNESFQIPYFLLEAMAVVFGGVAIIGAAAFSPWGVSTYYGPCMIHSVRAHFLSYAFLFFNILCLSLSFFASHCKSLPKKIYHLDIHCLFIWNWI